VSDLAAYSRIRRRLISRNCEDRATAVASLGIVGLKLQLVTSGGYLIATLNDTVMSKAISIYALAVTRLTRQLHLL
jgi:hypothetical protein